MGIACVHQASRNGTKTFSEIVVVTPELASKWLARNKKNRRVYQGRVALYASQMASGEWHLTHQGIAFDELGNLVDGQHRLLAVIESGVPIRFWVFNGVSRDAMIAIDMGKTRSAVDAFTFLGDDVNNRSVAVARILLGAYVFQRRKTERIDISYQVGLDRLRVFHSAMKEAIDFSALNTSEKGLRHACTSAAIASAWFTQNKELLSEFKDQFASGVVTSQADVAVVKLRNFMTASGKTRGGRDARADLFLRSSTALRAYVDRRPIAKLYASPDSVFPIPDVDGF